MWKPLKLFTEDLFEHVSASPSGITYKMLDPAHTSDEDIQTLCDELKITGLTWRIDDDILFLYKDPDAFVLDDEEEEQSEDEE
jgi:hypothetical protein